jgi:3-deoxy-D-manno-octulosonic-acid transferase
MLTIYNLLLLLALLISSPVLLYLAIVRGHSLKERLGFQDRERLSSLGTHPRVWFHAASVGEIKALAALLPHFKSAFPDHKILISTTTKTGRAQATRLIPHADLFTYLPLDFSWCLKRALRFLNPEALLIVETELWPNLLSLAKKSGIKTFLVNGRISSRSFKSYKRFRFLFTHLLSGVDSLMMQSGIDGERILKMGAPPDRVKIIGNIKFDYLALQQELIDKVKQNALNALFSGRRVIVAGSTRRGEEVVVLEAFRTLRSRFPDSLLILAPRHLARLKEVESLLNQGGWRFIRRCQLEGAGLDSSLEVILLDTMGELLTFYSLAEIAFVGGSLVPVGGHDPLEPATFAVPVLFGPHMQNAADSRDLLLESGGAREVRDSEELTEALIELLSNEDRRKKMGRAAQGVIDDNAGICFKVVEVLKSRLGVSRDLQ